MRLKNVPAPNNLVAPPYLFALDRIPRLGVAAKT